MCEQQAIDGGIVDLCQITCLISESHSAGKVASLLPRQRVIKHMVGVPVVLEGCQDLKHALLIGSMPMSRHAEGDSITLGVNR